MIERLLGLVAASALVLLMLIVLVDVIGRGVFNHPLAAGTELTELTLGAMAFLSFPLLTLRQRHITVDLFDFLARDGLRRLQVALSGLVVGALFAVLARQAMVFAGRTAASGESTPQLQVPLAWAWWTISALSVVTVVTALAVAMAAIIGRPVRAPPSPEVD